MLTPEKYQRMEKRRKNGAAFHGELVQLFFAEQQFNAGIFLESSSTHNRVFIRTRTIFNLNLCASVDSGSGHIDIIAEGEQIFCFYTSSDVLYHEILYFSIKC